MPEAIEFVSEVAHASLFKTECRDAEAALIAFNYLIMKARRLQSAGDTFHG